MLSLLEGVAAVGAVAATPAPRGIGASVARITLAVAIALGALVFYANLSSAGRETPVAVAPAAVAVALPASPASPRSIVATAAPMPTATPRHHRRHR